MLPEQSRKLVEADTLPSLPIASPRFDHHAMERSALRGVFKLFWRIHGGFFSASEFAFSDKQSGRCPKT
jgi:hypothetical protein